MTLVPTHYLRFVKRRVGANTVRILQQRMVDTDIMRPVEEEIWQDVPLADEKATQRRFPPKGD